MPFIAVPIAAAIFGAGTAAAAVGAAVIQAGIGFAISFAAQKLMPKPKSGGPSGVAVSLGVATDAPRACVFGEAWTAGDLGYWHVYGAGNKYLQMAILLASHEIDSVTELRVNGSTVTWDQGTGAVTEYPGGLMKVTLHRGNQVTADADLVANSGVRMTSNDIGRHIAYAAVTLLYDQAKFPQGIPTFEFRVRGAKLYDPRFDTTAGGSGAQRFADHTTWAWTANPEVIAYNLLRGFDGGTGHRLIGLNAPAAAIPYVDFEAAASACDEAVSLKAGGTEARYRCGFVARGERSRDALEAALSACAGAMVHSGGVYRLQAGVARSVVATLTDDDLIASEPLTTSPRLSRSELVNTVTGSYAADETAGKGLKPLPPRSSSTDVADDGGYRLAVDLDLGMVRSRSQAQRLMEINRRRARRMLQVDMTARARWATLEPGDWVSFTSSRRGYVSRTFEIVRTERTQDRLVRLSLREMDEAFDDWTTSDELADEAVSDLPPGTAGVASISGFALFNATIAAGAGAERPGLRATWTPPSDPSVVEIVVEFRKSGDTVALERRVVNPEAGTYTWLDGVQGGITYQARIRPVTSPDRGTDWTAWVSTGADAAPQIVAVAAMALSASPGSITPEMLDAQSRFELGLATQLDTTQSSVNARLALVYAEIARINKVVTETLVWQDETETFTRREELTRSTETSELARITDELAAVLEDPATGLAAQAAAREILEGRVDTAEGEIDANSSAITALQSTVNDPSTGVGATASGLSSLTATVNHATTGLATRASASEFASLQSSVTSPFTGLSTKASIFSVNTVSSNLGVTNANVSAQASQINSLSTTVNGHTSSINTILQVEGGNKRFAIVLDSNDKVTGVFSLDGTESTTALNIGVSQLNVFDPTVAGGVPLPLLQVATVGGEAQMILNGTFITKAIEAGVINALSGSIGHLTSAKITSPNGKLMIDATGSNAIIQITSG